MKLLFILLLALFSNSSFTQTLKNSDDNFINLTNEIKSDQKTSNDVKNDLKFKNAYFNRFKNTWHHGDYAEIKMTGGFVIHGRSDTTLNPGGVRMGTAEIYSEVEKFKEINESLVVGQAWKNDIRIVLFIVMNKKYSFTEKLSLKLKLKIRKNTSPRHVPSKIIVVNDIPRTKSGKNSEILVKKIINNDKVQNLGSLANPESVIEYRKININE